MPTSYDLETASDLRRVYAPTFEPFSGIINAEGLIAEARAATGLTNLGGSAQAEPGFLIRLNALCAALESESRLTPTGRTRAHGRLLAMIVSRLRLIDYVRQAGPLPEIRRPFIGTGMPRTGTSFLQALLGQDPENLVPRTGHSMMPVPPPGVLSDEQVRLDIVRDMLDFQGLDDDEVNAIHPFAPDAEDEDTVFQEGACGGLYQAFFDVPSFVTTFQQTYGELFAWQKQLMQVIQASQTGTRWVMKGPEYLVQLDRVRSIYPDGMIFVNHRDPARVVPSIASLFVTFRALNTEAETVPREVLGPALLQGQIQSLKLYENWRAANPDVKVVDIRYKDLVADPVGTADMLYGEFGLTLSDAGRRAMTDFLAVNRHGQASGGARHTYSLADFGLTEDMIEEAFGDYLDRYAIARERGR